ncbi:hypothetical protein DFH29DRAFT_882260 [Suillus ampliporus]|nr:hypothetical protein DFH29DRAFT_882260 [Suillus ampliporus]
MSSMTVPFFIERVFTSSSPPVIFVNRALSTASPELTIIDQNHREFENAVRSRADESVLHVYKAVFYNIPVQVKPSQSIFYVTRGAHIGVVAGWENALNCVLGVAGAVYHDVESIAIGEEKVRIAIDEGRIQMVEPWAFPEQPPWTVICSPELLMSAYVIFPSSSKKCQGTSSSQLLQDLHALQRLPPKLEDHSTFSKLSCHTGSQWNMFILVLSQKYESYESITRIFVYLFPPTRIVVSRIILALKQKNAPSQHCASVCIDEAILKKRLEKTLIYSGLSMNPPENVTNPSVPFFTHPPEPLHEQFGGDGMLEALGSGNSLGTSRRSVSRERSLPVGLHDPHSMQEAPPALSLCDVILPQPSLATMQGQPHDMAQPDLPIYNGAHHPITPESYDFSSLNVPSSWNSMPGGLFDVMQPPNLFTPHQSHPSEPNTPPHVPLPPGLNIPATHVIPPTPANTVVVGNLAMNTEGEPSGAIVVGRRSEDTNAAMEKQFDLIDRVINELVVLTGIPTQQVLNLFLKSRGRINNGPNHWNIYRQYFKAHHLCKLQRAGKDANVIITSTVQGECYQSFQGTYPDDWQDILDTFYETQIASGPSQTVAQRSQEFTRLTKKVTSLLDLATAKHGFEAALLMCGKVVNQDASIGYVHTTPGAEEFWASRCRADEDTMVGHFKAHVYHLASLAVVEDYGFTWAAGAHAQVVTEDDDEVQEVPDNLDWKTLADHIQCIKVGITSMFRYPEDMLMLGEPRVMVARPKGISDLDKCERVVLADALRSGRLTIERQKNGDLNKTSPIIFGEAPPEDSMHACGHHMLVDGTINRQGMARLGPSAAGTKVKKLNPSTCKEAASRRHVSPIPVNDKSSQPQTIPHKQKLVPFVELRSRPPPRPLKAANGKKASTPAAREVIPIDMSSDAQAGSESDTKDEFKEDQDPLEGDDSDYDDEVATSRKHKVKASRGYRSQKRRVPSNVKGKGKATNQGTGKGQKAAKKVRYVSVISEPDSEHDGREPLRLRDGPEDSLQPCTQHGLPKPKKVVPGSSEGACQAALYSEGKRQPQAPGGSSTSQEVAQGGLDTSQAAQQGGLRGPRTSRWDLPLRGQEDTFTKDLQASDRLQVPSPAPSSPSPQSRQPPRQLLPVPHNQHSMTSQPNGQQHIRDRSLPLPSSHGSTIEYRPTTQRHLPSTVNHVPGVNMAHQPQYSTDARNAMYTYPPPLPHNSHYPAHSESYQQGTGAYNTGRDAHDACAPAYQEYSGYRDSRTQPRITMDLILIKAGLTILHILKIDE